MGVFFEDFVLVGLCGVLQFEYSFWVEQVVFVFVVLLVFFIYFEFVVSVFVWLVQIGQLVLGCDIGCDVIQGDFVGGVGKFGEVFVEYLFGDVDSLEQLCIGVGGQC